MLARFRDKDAILKILHLIATVDPEYGGPVEGILRQNEVIPGTMEIASLDSPHAGFLADFPIKTYPLGEYKTGEGWVHFLKRYGVSRKYLRWLSENASNYDCVIVNGLWNFSSMAASLTLPSSNVPYFVFTHGMLDPWFRTNFRAKHLLKQFFWLFSECRLLANSESVLFTTKEERDLARTMFWGHNYRAEVVGYGTAAPPPSNDAQEEQFRLTVPALGDRKYLLFLSRIHSKKGCDLLIRAFASIASRFRDIDLVVAGPDQSGLKEQLQREAAGSGIADRVHWPGMITGDAKWGAFRSAEAFVLPSHSENFGVVVAEALACSTPVLISNKVNIWHEIEDERAGFVDDDSVEGTVRLLDRYLSLSPDERSCMRTRARVCFLKHFDIKERAAALQRLLEASVERKKLHP
jgi:glycosyltransferase involved in cell wall biosynthesis